MDNPGERCAAAALASRVGARQRRLWQRVRDSVAWLCRLDLPRHGAGGRVECMICI